MIITHINPPIPDRNFDYSATLDDYEPGDIVGYGVTPGAAAADLDDLLELTGRKLK